MGGKALKNIETRRLSLAEITATASAVCLSISQDWNVRNAVIPWYRSKPDFGDLDVVVASDDLPFDLQSKDAAGIISDWATQHHHARDFLFNDSVVSFDYRSSSTDQVGFQVDLIFTPNAEFDCALDYFSYNDTGNLIGRVAHKMGLSYGHKGLTYPWREDTHVFRTLTVTNDMAKAREFLGLQPGRFEQGFEDLPEIFDYIQSGSRFNPDIFLLENRNHTSRTRDKKRATYRAFLEHIAAHPTPHPFIFPEDKGSWLPFIFSAFPKFAADFERTKNDLAAAQSFKKIFSGNHVQEWTGLQGKELGVAMQVIRRHFQTDDAIRAHIEKHGVEEFRNLVLTLPLSGGSFARPKGA